MTSDNVPTVQPAKVPLKARLTVWLIYAGAGVMLVLFALAIAGNLMEIGTLPECDSQRARDTMSDVFSAAKYSLTKYNEIKTVSSSKDEVTCKASLAIKGGGTLIADYTFFWDGRKVMVRHTLTRM
jgi:hypothetical protein